MEHRLKAHAIEFRNGLGYSSTEPIDFISLLRRIDVLTIFKPLGDDFSGLSIKDGAERFMLVNCNQSIGRQNFTIGHELYHLFYDPDFTPHRCKTGLFPKKNDSERFADLFASHLLLPEEGIIRLIPDKEMAKDKIRLATLLKIEQTFGSSRRALLYKLLSMRLVSHQFIDEHSSDVKINALQHGYSTDLYEPSGEKAILGSYGSLANKLFDEEKISEGHFRELMLAIGVDLNELTANDDD